MGYTTKFSGEFKFVGDPPLSVIRKIQELEYADENPEGAPKAYSQWVPNKDLTGIVWNGQEKFYFYVEWLQWIIDTILKPEKVMITGRVEFSGEDAEDIGVIIVEEDQHVRVEKVPLVSDEIEDLKAFRDWVIRHYDDAMSEYAEFKKRGW